MPAAKPAPSAAVSPTVSGTEQKSSPETQIPKTDNPEKTAYEKALDLYQRNQYQTSRQQFQAFLKQYPKSSFADNALYWVGECYSSENLHQDAVATFQQVIDRYPNGNKTPNAYLKQSAAFQQLGDKTAARIIYQRLIEK